jgi:hypothetical protein
MSTKTDKLLNHGLKEGFGGSTVMSDVQRTGFSLKSSHFENEDGVYHDEWFADRAGGGQEIVKSEEITYTRVYAGGTIPLEKLADLGISKSDVMKFLKKQITENGEKIRLYSNFEPAAEGDWQYSYKVINSDLEIPLTAGKETIKFKGNLVFVHVFVISPVD